MQYTLPILLAMKIRNEEQRTANKGFGVIGA